MITRTFDGRELTSIANDPLVRPLLGGEGEVDLVPFASIPRNFVFMLERSMLPGGWLLSPLYDGHYEAHTVMTVGANPRQVARGMNEVIEYMFLRTDCETILTKVPDSNAGAAWLAKYAGFELAFHRNDAWGPEVGISYMKLPLDRWAAACSTVLDEGRKFHELLEQAKNAMGSELPVHPEDEAHDRAVGACVAMIKSGNTIKGINYYNKWAAFAGYGQTQLLSEQPVVVDIGDAILGLTNGEVEILQCR